jgi:hypothetical protein
LLNTYGLSAKIHYISFMGMYDIITVKDKLPWTDEMWEEGLPNKCTSFQAKGLIECLANYKIENGRLLLQESEKKWTDQNYHGKLSFYDYAPNDKLGNNDCWIEFVATFTNGQVDKIEVSKFEKNDNTERIEKWNQVLSEMLHERKRWINRFFFHTKPVRWTRRRIHEALYYIGDFFTRLSYKF